MILEYDHDLGRGHDLEFVHDQCGGAPRPPPTAVAGRGQEVVAASPVEAGSSEVDVDGFLINLPVSLYGLSLSPQTSFSLSLDS